MQKALGLALTTVLLLGLTSCAEQGANQNNSSTTNATATATPAASATPLTTASPTSASPTPTASPTTDAPSTASVENVGLKWRDSASGTPVTTIKVGGTVTWKNTGGNHSLKRVAPNATNGCQELEAGFDSNLSAGQPVSRKFDKVGTFGYQCGIHGGTPNCNTPPGSGTMPGVVKVVP